MIVVRQHPRTRWDRATFEVEIAAAERTLAERGDRSNPHKSERGNTGR